MQALTPTVFPCYAAADRRVAAGIAAFLERGANVRVFLHEGEMRPGEDLAGKAREARMVDVVLVLFSRSSIPSRWRRSEWEDALRTEPAAEGTRICFLKCDDCIPPLVLTPRRTKRRARSYGYWKDVDAVNRLASKTIAGPVNSTTSCGCRSANRRSCAC